MKFWVVSDEGLVGREMCDFLQREAISFVGSNRYEVDILDEKGILAFFDKHKPTHIVNCAAVAIVDNCEVKDRERAFTVNAIGPQNLARLARIKGARLIHIGTDYVFDGREKRPYEEGDPVNPINEYGFSKLEGEKLLFKEYPEAVEVRTSSLYGLGKKGLIWYILQALQSEEIVQGITDQTSSPTNTKDLVEALFAVRDQSGIFHFANKGEASRFGLIEELFRLAKASEIELRCKKVVPIRQEESKRSAPRPVYSVLSSKKIAPYLRKEIRTWQEALADYFEAIAVIC
jgi:dTDP-4-dehydrorhamnose reductase